MIYDDMLLDCLHESNIPDYFTSLSRLRDLPVDVVYPGHGDPFTGQRMLELIDEYLRSRCD